MDLVSIGVARMFGPRVFYWRCGHVGRVSGVWLSERMPPDASTRHVADELRCSVCGSRNEGGWEG